MTLSSQLTLGLLAKFGAGFHRQTAVMIARPQRDAFLFILATAHFEVMNVEQRTYRAKTEFAEHVSWHVSTEQVDQQGRGQYE